MNLTPTFFVSALAEYWYVFVILIFLGFLKTPFLIEPARISQQLQSLCTSVFL
jgi:hypothetical protein